MKKEINPKLDRLAVWTLDETATYLRVSRRKFDGIRRSTDFPGEVKYDPGAYPHYRACDIIDWVATRRVAA